MTEPKQTEFAMAAVDFAGLFNSYFEPVEVAGYRVKLTAPEGPSTGGGVQARQHITLVDEAGGRTIVMGGCNSNEKKAELRVYDHVAKRFAERYDGLSFPVQRGQFDDLRQKLAQFFQGQGYSVASAQAPATPASTTAKPGGGGAGIWIAITLLLLAIAGAAVWYFVFYQAD